MSTNSLVEKLDSFENILIENAASQSAIKGIGFSVLYGLYTPISFAVHPVKQTKAAYYAITHPKEVIRRFKDAIPPRIQPINREEFESKIRRDFIRNYRLTHHGCDCDEH